MTHYQTIAYNKDADLSFIRLLLETGRTHQIRVHMKAIGHPLPGDFLYCPDYRFIDRQAVFNDYFQYRHSSYIAWDRIHPNQIGATVIARAFLEKCGFDYNHRPEHA